MQHLLHAMRNRGEPTDAMEFGTLCHAAILEPRRLHSRYCVMPDLTAGILKPDGTAYDNVKLTKEYKQRLAQWEEMETRICISQDQMSKATAIVEAVRHSERASRWLGNASIDRPDIEVCLVWDDPETGLRCKARLDAIWPDRPVIVDVKTTADACEFSRSICRYGYHRQAAFYIDGATAVLGAAAYSFNVIALETAEPFALRCAPMSVTAIETGRQENRKLLRQLARCIESNRWPGYDDPDYWWLPGWYGEPEPVSLTIDGQRVAVE
jgi:hypothetical protein